MQHHLRNIIVTGSNKGIGFGIVQNLIQKPHWNIIMACRNIELAEKAKHELTSRFQGSQKRLHVEQLDVTDKGSIDKFVKIVEQKYKGIDVLINNAGCARKGDAFDEEVATWTFATNFYGTVNFTDAILRLIVDSGKIIFVGSLAGKITRLSQELKNRFRNPNLNREQLYQLMNEFIVGVKQGNYAQKGWTKSCYGTSKIGINHFARVLSKQNQVIQRKIQVYALCPGFVDTDMTSHKGVLTIQQGAQTPVFLTELPFEVNQKYQGQFFEKCALSSVE